ncbi:proline--tRNA ligase [Candidatus Bandiella numerosa]|uniref:proline--tRNA ligase n=1 Tax=Candidatus Bandiella numerosa TaxID=2570586 RepID=UPI00249EAA97|nr:proline--tRNA ligase [Candidatus Bandiella numerosa]WHA04695.1 proline--tRNA ligase [Candidatus Bandiella numerosa]
MRLSKFLLNTTKDITSEAKLISHQLMLRSGMIKQVSSGVYCWLPLGVKVLDKIKCIIKHELDSINSHEIILPSLQPLSIWEKSGRALEESDLKSQIFHLTDQKQNKYVLPPSGEEVVTDLFSSSVHSYKDVNKILYQITWKFRDEIRPRHGVMRAKEFLMKDAYSFDVSKEEALLSYEKILVAYLKIFKKLELEVVPVLAPTGAMGGDYSHEFHVLAQNGESIIYYQKELLNYLKSNDFSLDEYEKFYAKEEEKHTNENMDSLNILKSKSIEVGHLFYLGQKYSKDLNCTYQDKDGSLRFPEMGCYGIGITRLIAAIIENSYDENGIIWPDSISPFRFVIINIRSENNECNKLSERIYGNLSNKYDVLYDDTNSSAGKKFADMDLVGISWQIIIGPKHAINNSVELKNRKTGEVKILKEEELYNIIKEIQPFYL